MAAKQPTIRDIMKMVEDVFENSDTSILTTAKIGKVMPIKVPRERLVTALNKLIKANKIYSGAKGMTWIENKSVAIRSALQGGRRI